MNSYLEVATQAGATLRKEDEHSWTLRHGGVTLNRRSKEAFSLWHGDSVDMTTDAFDPNTDSWPIKEFDQKSGLHLLPALSDL